MNPPKDLKEELMESFEEDMPDLMVSTDIEPRHLNEHKVRKFLSSALTRMQESTREEILRELIIIRDTELSDTPMQKSRAAFNINVLIESLKKTEEKKI